MTGFIRKKGNTKRTILKGVYEENLRMVGNGPGYHKKQRFMSTLMMLGSMTLLGLAIVFLWTHPTLLRNPFSRVKTPSLSRSGFQMTENSADPGQFRVTSPSPSQYNRFLNSLGTPLSQIFGLQVKTIIIDPGHGGKDPGAVGKQGTLEKDITLDIARKLKKRLKKYRRYEILMTRETDTHLSLEDRIDFANSRQADIYISIHVNYIPNKPANIIETYYFGPNTDRNTLMLVEKENRGAQYTLSDFREIIKKIGHTVKIQESNLLAQCIQKSLYENIKKHSENIEDWGVRTAPFVVLLGVDIPSVLSEVTCLSNALEEEKLIRESYREEIARYLEQGVVLYLNQKNKK